MDGKICNSTLQGRVFAMPVELLLKVPYSIGVAGGKLKAEAILGALRGKYINILITDNLAAEKILKLASKTVK
jgi:DNA-binding transcriptional regulator LsrR (DeoR family)